MLYAFDLLELDGNDLLPLPLGDRKAIVGGYGCTNGVPAS
jgi:ATP-dependent DNA ligase